MLEFEKLLEKFEKMLTEEKGERAQLASAVDELKTAITQQGDANGEMSTRIEDLEKAVEAKTQTIDELKAIVLNMGNSISERDPDYKGVFPNRKRAKQFGLWVLAIAEHGQVSERARIALDKMDKALAEGVNSTGGALVPEVFDPTLIVLQEQYGTFRREARNVPMSSDTQSWPKLDGTITVYYPGEAGTITASNPTFQNVQLQAKKGCALTAISSELEEDAAVAIGEIVIQQFARGMAKAEDQAGFLGDGTSTYWGFTGIAGALRAVDGTIGNIKSLNVASGNAYSEIILPDFDDIVGLYPDYADDENVKWYMHRYFQWTVVRKLVLAYSSNIPTAGTQPMDVRSGGPGILDGYPIEQVNVMPKTEANSQICALLANLQLGCYLGIRRGMTIDRSREVYFTTDQIGLRATWRHAINCFGVGDTTDPGPVMGLITAAA